MIEVSVAFVVLFGIFVYEGIKKTNRANAEIKAALGESYDESKAGKPWHAVVITLLAFLSVFVLMGLLELPLP